VLVTGGSRGIGASIVTVLSQFSKNLIFTYKEQQNQAFKLCDNLQTSNCNVQAFQLDISDLDSILNFSKEFKKLRVNLDGLVHNAGINMPTDFDKVNLNDWDNILATNLRGPFLLTKEISKSLNRKASIVSISSVSGQYGGPRTPHYAASKAGLISLTQVMARFFSKRNIRANTIAAGLIDSEMASQGFASKTVINASENILLKRLGQPEEVAEVVLFLLSDMSSYITAQTINVNGGLYF